MGGDYISTKYSIAQDAFARWQIAVAYAKCPPVLTGGLALQPINPNLDRSTLTLSAEHRLDGG